MYLCRPSTGLILACALSPMAAFSQTNPCPKQDHLVLPAKQAAQFSQARSDMHDAVLAYIKLGDIKGEATRPVLDEIRRNAQVIETLATLAKSPGTARCAVAFHEFGGKPGDAKGGFDPVEMDARLQGIKLEIGK